VKPSPEDIIQAIYDAAEKGLRVVVVSGAGAGVVELGPTSLTALEEIQVNITGEGGIATETTLAALLSLLTPGIPEQRVGTVGVAAVPVTFSGPTKHVCVSNPTKNTFIEVSFDGGASYVKVPGEQALCLPCRVTGALVRAVGATLPYDIVATV
jgi:fructose-1-phosphate kinase PfkB-like protein